MADHACPDCGALHKEKPLSLKQRVAELEDRVRALEARSQWSWTTVNHPLRQWDNTTVSAPATSTIFNDS